MKIEIIAELAQGFEGSVHQAKLLIAAAAKSGANAAKFQMVYSDELATPDYQYYQLFSNLELSDSEWLDIKATCDHYNIELILDVFGKKGLKLAETMGVRSIKLHATDINNIGFLTNIANSAISRVMLGAGGAYTDEIEEAVAILASKHIVLFHGFQGYPTLINENQMSRLNVWKTIFAQYNNISFGFSDHVDPNCPSSISLPAFAVGQGVSVLEKHLTLGRCMELEDHESAMNPDQFKVFVSCIEDINEAFGNPNDSNDFGMSEAEEQYRKNIRRHVVTVKEIPSGQLISASDVVLKRTSAKEAYTDIQSVYGKIPKRSLAQNTAITIGTFE